MLTEPPDQILAAGSSTDEPVRVSSVGDWRVTTDGSALLLAPGLDLAAVTAACRAVRARQLPGVWPILDLVADSAGVRLLTGAPLRPTLEDLLDGTEQLTPVALAGIVNEVGQTLQALRSAGWQHVDLRAESVVFGPEGVARLCDVGVRLASLDMGSATEGEAWARLVDRVRAGHRAASIAEFAEFAEIARSAGLEAALGRLSSWARTLPDEGDRRVSVRTTVAAALRAVGPTADPTKTVIAARAAGAQPAAATMLGRRYSERSTAVKAEPHGADEIRFGPGVSALPPPAPAPPVASRRKRRRFRFVALLLVAVAAGVIWWLLHRSGPLVTSSVTMTSVRPPTGCDSAAELRAVVATNGNAGTIAYRWLRSDGTSSAVLHARVSPGQRTEVLSMRWLIEGTGSYHGRATLLLLSPTRASAVGTFDYHCA